MAKKQTKKTALKMSKSMNQHYDEKIFGNKKNSKIKSKPKKNKEGTVTISNINQLKNWFDSVFI